jgi:hypothetical protein
MAAVQITSGSPELKLHPEATPQPRKLWISKCHEMRYYNFGK